MKDEVSHRWSSNKQASTSSESADIEFKESKKETRFRKRFFKRDLANKKKTSRLELLNYSTSEEVSSPKDLNSPRTPHSFSSSPSLTPLPNSTSMSSPGLFSPKTPGSSETVKLSNSEHTISEFSFRDDDLPPKKACTRLKSSSTVSFFMESGGSFDTIPEVENNVHSDIQKTFAHSESHCHSNDQSSSPKVSTTKIQCPNGSTSKVKIVRHKSWQMPRELCLLVTTIVFGLTCTSFIFLYFKARHQQPTAKLVQQPCTTPACLRAASRVLDRMDRSVSPCDDFYQFTCGSYIKNNIVPDDAPHRSSMQEMWEDVLVIIRKMVDRESGGNETEAVGKAKRLYHSCMNTSFTVHEKEMANSPIFELLSDEFLGGWPILYNEDSWNETQYDFEKLLSQLTIYQVHTFFDSYITPDDKNSSRYTLQFYKGSPALAINYYLNTSNEEYTAYIDAYKALMEEVITTLNKGESVNASAIDELLGFEFKFAAISDSKTCDANLNVTAESFNGTLEIEDMEQEESIGKMTVLQLEKLTPEIRWSRLLKFTLDEFNDLDLDVNNLVVSLHCTAFVPKLVQLLAETPNRVIANYLIWRFLLRYLPYVSTYFQQIWQQFRAEVPDPFEERTYISRWKECAAVVNEGFGAALASMYIQEYYNLNISEKVDKMVENVKEAFHQVIMRQDWIEDDMKEVCDEKLFLMGKKIAYPDYIETDEQLNAEFEGLEILEDHFLNNILRMKKHELWKELQKLTRTVDKKRDWLIQPLIVNAFHSPTANEIILPLGILREPFYNPGYPMYLNYGSLGVVVGHELVHGFDNHGKKYDKHGNLSQWWSERMVEEFTERAACFIDQYSQYPLEMVGKNVDGNNTLGDNICDNTGLINAWIAYQNWVKENGAELPLPGLNYTIPQIFLITFGQIWCEVVSKEGYEKYSTDMHSPGVYRTNGVVRNSDFFSETWGCPLGSQMNPERKCKLWI